MSSNVAKLGKAAAILLEAIDDAESAVDRAKLADLIEENRQYADFGEAAANSLPDLLTMTAELADARRSLIEIQLLELQEAKRRYDALSKLLRAYIV
jgi:hypothetical protein